MSAPTVPIDQSEDRGNVRRTIRALRRAIDPADRERNSAAICAHIASTEQWDGAHAIVQVDEQDPVACWIHAVLHKEEGDSANARYWYGLAGQFYESYQDRRAELSSIKATLTY